MTRTLTIVGLGALGSHLALLLRTQDLQLRLVDFDRVEKKNTLSQFHTRMGVGRNKAQALQQALQGLFSVRAQAVPHRLVADNAQAVLGGSDLLVDCVDHAPTRLLLQAYAREQGLPCLHGALAADGAYARVHWSERFAVDEGGEGEATCEDGQHLPFIATVSAHMALVLQRFLETGERRELHLHPGGVIPV